jgi:hypothetical protein
MTNLQSLEDKIKSPALRTVYDHWCAARGDRLMPAWRDIDAAAIGKYLAKTWAWRFDPAQDTFIGRLAGEDITAVLGREIRGRRFADCFPSHSAAMVEARHRKVIRDPAIMFTTGRVYVLTGGYGLGERIVLPLSEDGVTGDGVLGVTDYRLNMSDVRSVGATIDHDDEKISYYPLAPTRP